VEAARAAQALDREREAVVRESAEVVARTIGIRITVPAL